MDELNATESSLFFFLAQQEVRLYPASMNGQGNSHKIPTSLRKVTNWRASQLSQSDERWMHEHSTKVADGFVYNDDEWEAGYILDDTLFDGNVVATSRQSDGRLLAKLTRISDPREHLYDDSTAVDFTLQLKKTPRDSAPHATHNENRIAVECSGQWQAAATEYCHTRRIYMPAPWKVKPLSGTMSDIMATLQTPDYHVIYLLPGRIGFSRTEGSFTGRWSIYNRDGVVRILGLGEPLFTSLENLEANIDKARETEGRIQR